MGKTAISRYKKDKPSKHIETQEELSDEVKATLEHTNKLFAEIAANNNAKKKENKKIKLDEGRYDPREAANLISSNCGGDEEEVLEQLDAAFESSAIRMFKPGSRQQTKEVSHAFEVYWDDLNEWLTNAYPRVRFRFPTPRIVSQTRIQSEADESQEIEIEAHPTLIEEPDEKLAALFDPVPVSVLEKMFPANGKWAAWAEKAKANKLIHARHGRAKFNPYEAGIWFVFVQTGNEGWDTARLLRTLQSNLPARSRDDAHLLCSNPDFI